MEKITHKVLALKYRPANFSQLIGQPILVETITNSIKLNKLPNAYLLTGIRGVGKTTTARLIAKAINCEKNFIEQEKSKPDKQCECSHCEEIANSRHIDVLEMDAASKTGIDDVRELIESSKYNPTSAKYKIFIIDEVHMLSKQAFNGLLKTLEEPPPHLKFIFATTEVKKIPLTIISRCQRFDLNRVPVEVLFNNIKKISTLENGKISEQALKLIAKASEGSVRDSLSLLDRALISQTNEKEKVDENLVRKMLGIADRTKILKILHFIIQGDQKKSTEQLRELINEGLDPTNFLNDLLEMIHFILQRKELNDLTADLPLSEAETEIINFISKEVSTSTLIIFWQFILKGLEELSIVSNQILLLEMLIIKLLHIKEMPSYESALDTLQKNNLEEKQLTENKPTRKTTFPNTNEKKQISKEQIKTTDQTKLDSSILKENLPKDASLDLEKINNFEDLINLASKKKEIELKYDLERHVSIVKFLEGKVDITFNEKLSKNFVRKLSEKLLEWTGKRWVISLTKEIGKKNYLETKKIEEEKIIEDEKNNEVYKKFKDLFPDGELVKVEKEN